MRVKKELEQPDPFIEALYKGVALIKEYQKAIRLGCMCCCCRHYNYLWNNLQHQFL